MDGRRARVGPGLLEMVHQRALCDMRAAVSLAPELRAGLEAMQTQDGAVSALMHLALVSQERRDLFTFGQKRPINFFLDREAGMSILFDLLASQSPDRTRLLDEAPISRYALARRYGVSRAHINKLFAESGQTDAIGDRVRFSKTLSEALEDQYAQVFALNQGCARILMSGWRYHRGGQAAPTAAGGAAATAA